MEQTYKAFRIQTFPQLNYDTDCWIPRADISWNDEGKQCHQILAGPSDRFKIIDQAETYALEMAMDWIDAEMREDLTP
jgi:hypothetical protein